MNGPDAVEWQEAIDYEISQLEKLGAWEIVDAPKNANIIPCHYVLATKRGPDGEKLKLRARLVANGQRQQYGLDYFATFASVAKFNTLRILLAIITERNLEADNIDIDTAFLNPTLKEEVVANTEEPGLRHD